MYFSRLKDAVEEIIIKYGNDLHGTQQLMIVVNDSRGKKDAMLFPCIYRPTNAWEILPVISVTIGKNGFALPDQKTEGDKKSPEGLFAIGTAFGYNESLDTGLNYIQVTRDDLWIDDPEHKDYNKWVKSPTDARSYEVMRRKDHQYKMGAVIKYNTHPIIPGKGSAVFLHIQEAAGIGTSACIAMEKTALGEIMQWLDKKQSPAVLMGYPDDLLLMR